MNKPMTVARQEFAENLVNVINNAQLPAFVMLDIIKTCEAELSKVADAQYESDKQEYEKSLKEEEEAEK